MYSRFRLVCKVILLFTIVTTFPLMLGSGCLMDNGKNVNPPLTPHPVTVPPKPPVDIVEHIPISLRAVIVDSTDESKDDPLNTAKVNDLITFSLHVLEPKNDPLQDMTLVVTSSDPNIALSLTDPATDRLADAHKRHCTITPDPHDPNRFILHYNLPDPQHIPGDDKNPNRMRFTLKAKNTSGTKTTKHAHLHLGVYPAKHDAANDLPAAATMLRINKEVP